MPRRVETRSHRGWMTMVFAVALGTGCASTTMVSGSNTSPVHEHGEEMSHTAVAGEGPQAIEVPMVGDAQVDRKATVLLDTRETKLVSIWVRSGTGLPEHQSEVPVLIQSASGEGVVTAGTSRFRLDQSHSVWLPARVRHAVSTEGTKDLVLLVHHLRAGAHAE